MYCIVSVVKVFHLSNPTLVLAVSKVLIAPIFWDLRNFETEADSPEKHGIKWQDLRKICQNDSGFFVNFFPVQSYRCLKKLSD